MKTVIKIQKHGELGYDICYDIERPPETLYSLLSEYSASDISDMLNGMYTFSSSIKNMVNDKKLIAPACTVKVSTGDNLMLHKALEVAQPNDVLVVDAGSEEMHAICGELISRKAKHLGIAGIIIDGMVRDIEGLKDVDLPIFARGITPLGPKKTTPGQINHLICCGGVAIQPGDIIVADSDGIVVIRQEDLKLLIERMQKWTPNEKEYAKKVKEGDFDLKWVNEILKQNGYTE